MAIALTFIFKSLWELNTSQSGTLPTLPLLALFVLCFLARYVLRGNLCLLGMVPHVVDYSYSHLDYRRRFTAVSTARAIPARAMPKGRFPGGSYEGRSFSTYRVFFMTYAETALMYENTAWSAMGEKNQGDESACASSSCIWQKLWGLTCKQHNCKFTIKTR
jgi:hypothetical protein